MIPPSSQLFGLDTPFERCFLSQQVQGNMPQHSQVLGCVTLAHTAIVFPEDNIQNPVNLVLDAPVKHAQL